jgi:hypothetical protein
VDKQQKKQAQFSGVYLLLTFARFLEGLGMEERTYSEETA